MQQEVIKTTYGGAPGRPEWRDTLKSRLKVVNEVVTDQYMSAEVGADYSSQPLYELVRAMIIAYGSGSAVGNPPIEAGPRGRTVWDDALLSQGESEASFEGPLPKEFNQIGNHFIDNAVKLMQKHFKDTLDEASASLPSSVFYRNLHVKGGSR